MIKVADFGLSEDVYCTNYFRQGRQGENGEAPVKLPLRWMAIESLNDGVFSEKTDVVRLIASLIYSEECVQVISDISHAMVIWSDVLGGVFIGENLLPWSGPLFSHQISGERGEIEEAIQCSLFP